MKKIESLSGIKEREVESCKRRLHWASIKSLPFNFKTSPSLAPYLSSASAALASSSPFHLFLLVPVKLDPAGTSPGISPRTRVSPHPSDGWSPPPDPLLLIFTNVVDLFFGRFFFTIVKQKHALFPLPLLESLFSQKKRLVACSPMEGCYDVTVTSTWRMCDFSD